MNRGKDSGTNEQNKPLRKYNEYNDHREVMKKKMGTI